MKLVLVALILSLGLSAGAAPKSLSPVPGKILSGTGSKAGGIAGPGFTLLDIKSNFNRQAGIERLLIDVGDIDGRQRKGYPGYFQVELQNNSRRVVIDFAQMPASLVDVKKVQEKFKDSIFVKRAKMLADPSDDTLSLVLDLKKPAKLKVFQVPGQKTTSKVVLDLMS
jgi:hypothetical protein